MDEEEYQRELFKLVVMLAERFTHKESTSVPYEKAEALMRAVVFTLAHGGNRDSLVTETEEIKDFGMVVTDETLTMEEQYIKGRNRIVRQCKTLYNYYNQIANTFRDYGCIALRETFRKAIPGFFLYYDAEFAPYHRVITMDYNLLPQRYLDKEGIDAIAEYLHEIDAEQQFLAKIREDYVISMLHSVNPGYETQFESLTEPLLTNLLLRSMGRNGYLKQENLSLNTSTMEELMLVLQNATQELILSRYDNNKMLHEYLACYLPGIAVRISNADENGTITQLLPGVR